MSQPFHVMERPERLRLRVEDFVLLEESGAFADYGKAELIDGEIFVMNAQHVRHARAKVRLLVALSKCLESIGSDLEILSEVSLRVAESSMPEPDLVLARNPRFGPIPIDIVALVIEISDTTLPTDLGRKAALYAAAGIPEYWVLDLGGGRTLVHTRPRPSGYGLMEETRFGGSLAARTLDRVSVFVDPPID